MNMTEVCKTDFDFTLFLMGEKGYAVLSSIIEGGWKDRIKLVVGARDKAVKTDYYSEIRDMSMTNGITWSDRTALMGVESTYALAISWRWLIPDGCARLIVIHDSLLPKYRGFAPLVNMLLHHEPEIGATAIWASDEYDCGDIIAQEKVGISYPIKIKDAIEKITPVYCSIVKRIFSLLNDGEELPSIPQNNREASYSLWRDKDDYRIDWNASAEEVQQFIYAVGNPYLGAATYMSDGREVRIFDAQPLPDVNIVNRDNGKVIFMDHGIPIIVCGKGLLKLTDVRAEDGESLLPLSRFRVRFM